MNTTGNMKQFPPYRGIWLYVLSHDNIGFQFTKRASITVPTLNLFLFSSLTHSTYSYC